MQTEETLSQAAGIVAAYVANNSLPVAELPGLIAAVHAAIGGLGRDAVPEEPPLARATPAQIRRSITHEALISFEDGKPYKTLRRHLTMRGLTPEDYRAKWGLPADYPLVAASYSERRSELARSLGLGQTRRISAEMPETAATAEAAAPKQRGRRKAPAA